MTQEYENITFLPLKIRHSIMGVNLTMKKLYEILQRLEEKMIPREGRSVILNEDNFVSIQDELKDNLFFKRDPKEFKDITILGMKLIIDNPIGSSAYTYSVNYYE